MIKSVTYQIQVTEDHYFCDICGKDTGIKTCYGKDICIYCKKTLCSNCMHTTLPKDLMHILCNEDYDKWLNGYIKLSFYDKIARKFHNEEPYNERKAKIME